MMLLYILLVVALVFPTSDGMCHYAKNMPKPTKQDYAVHFDLPDDIIENKSRSSVHGANVKEEWDGFKPNLDVQPSDVQKKYHNLMPRNDPHIQ